MSRLETRARDCPSLGAVPVPWAGGHLVVVASSLQLDLKGASAPAPRLLPFGQAVSLAAPGFIFHMRRGL